MRYFLGIDLGDEELIYGLTDGVGKLLFKGEFPIEAKEGADDIVAAIKRAIDIVTHFSITESYPISGMGISTAGLVDTIVGKVVKGVNTIPSWDNIALSELLNDYVDYPIYVDNQAKTRCLAEHLYGAGRNLTDLVYIYVGKHLDGALFIDNKPFNGYKNRGAGFGQIPVSVVEQQGKVCTLNEVASIEALLKSYRTLLEKNGKEVPEELSAEYFFDQFLGGEYEAKSVFAMVSTYLCGTIAGFINIFSPQKVILGGDFELIDDVILFELQSKIKQYVVDISSTHTELGRATLKNSAGCIGAAALVYTA